LWPSDFLAEGCGRAAGFTPSGDSPNAPAALFPRGWGFALKCPRMVEPVGREIEDGANLGNATHSQRRALGEDGRQGCGRAAGLTRIGRLSNGADGAVSFSGKVGQPGKQVSIPIGGCLPCLPSGPGRCLPYLTPLLPWPYRPYPTLAGAILPHTYRGRSPRVLQPSHPPHATHAKSPSHWTSPSATSSPL
jgi:hypothetical protein